MKKTLLFLLLFAILAKYTKAQITTAVVRANFGVDADLRSNYLTPSAYAGIDDWFRLPGLGSTVGKTVIDTTGAAAMMLNYTANPSSRQLPFYRLMAYEPYTVVNNRLLIDAIFTRDYHGSDSTMFASGSNKNGMSPAAWSSPVAQSVPDKNEILDMMCHVRREGPNLTDSLWLFGGVSIENTTGDRYFDFEMYQTDIFYNRSTLSFSGYGPDAGHTSWKFDAAGNITTPGDIIFSADYGSSTLTSLEARIWVKYTDWQTITPTGFNWNGTFDGAASGAAYGYAGITPNGGGVFYTGLESVNNTWAGPFQLVLGNGTVTPNYTAGQYMEFSVNLTKLGLDPVTLLGGNACNMPFRRILVKSRSSTSFTAALKDFIGPFDFFVAPKVDLSTNAPLICDSGSVSNLFVTNPVSTSTYIWSTNDGVISGSNTGTSINVTKPGTYYVAQYLQGGCSAYALDTLQVLPFSGCVTLQNNLTEFSGSLDNNISKLKWAVQENSYVTSFELERSFDGVHFYTVKKIDPQDARSRAFYNYDDNISNLTAGNIFYRLKINQVSGVQKYSQIVALAVSDKTPMGISILPNPAKDYIQLSTYSSLAASGTVQIYDAAGRLFKTKTIRLLKGNNSIIIDDIYQYPPGTYLLTLNCNRENFQKRFVVVK